MLPPAAALVRRIGPRALPPVAAPWCVATPRPLWPPSLWPPSLSTTRTLRPTLRWETPDGLGDATVELCEDPACATVIATMTVAGESAAPELYLPARPIFWRVSASARTGPTWRSDVARRAAPIESAWGIAPDYNGAHWRGRGRSWHAR